MTDRQEYQQRIAADVAWLETLPQCAERDHAIAVLRESVNAKCPTGETARIADLCAEVEQLDATPDPAVEDHARRLAGLAIDLARGARQLLRALSAARSDRDFLKRREQYIIEACERVADGGQYCADIVSAIQRIRRERDALADAARVACVARSSRALDGLEAVLVEMDKR